MEELESKISTEYDGRSRTLYKLSCNLCEKDYWRPKKKLETSKCCSQECFKEWRAKIGKRIDVTCTHCRNLFKRFKHYADRVESGRLFCSRKCQAEFFSKDRGNCSHCQKQLGTKQEVYCSHECQIEFQYTQNIQAWKSGEINGINDAEALRGFVRRYMIEKYGNKCSLCGWDKVNPTTGKVPIQIDHIDGNYKNNDESNLRILCPNCHSLTPTFGGLNKGRGREKRREKLRNNKNNLQPSNNVI